ncbi:hypothetical protein PAHAL_4G051500 [Panicum hallii]|jgi:nuclear transcription factor Y, gamma|uniref:Core Histone H2A/H2B/H3 domain-containing protein n=1 Tax=Panicum hallii TaxID=206008 RepID=A0A2S3HHI0_9POAL|nr:nuclear transcription factor Y subunit C-4-like [Panicum hallii]PAN22893.1 hypothetical protein PAHAL_4G051500 [Panicum hallii]
MEPPSQTQPAIGVAAYPPAATIATPAIEAAGLQPGQAFAANPAQMSAQHQIVYQQAQQFHQQLQQQQQRQLQQFWDERVADIEQTTDFKNHTLPLARIKKIMKADEDVRMISAEAPVVFAKACEIFILELTLRSWMHTEENKRRTLQKNDIAAAITRTDIYDFLVDIVPRDEMKEEGVGLPRAGLPPMGAPADAHPYYLWQEPQEQQEPPPEEQQSLRGSG